MILKPLHAYHKKRFLNEREVPVTMLLIQWIQASEVIDMGQALSERGVLKYKICQHFSNCNNPDIQPTDNWTSLKPFDH